MSLEKMICGENYTTELIKDNINGLIDNSFGFRSKLPQDVTSVTFGVGGNGGSLISGGDRQYPAVSGGLASIDSDPSFSYIGAPQGAIETGSSDSVTGVLFSGADPSSSTGYWVPKISFDYTGSEVEVQFRAQSSGDTLYQVAINGVNYFDSFQVVSVSSGGQYKVRLEFPSEAVRNITISALKLDFKGVIKEPSKRAIKPSSYSKIKVAVLSNSICAGYAFETFRLQTWPNVIGENLGFEVYNVSVGGTGYTSSASPTYESRLQDLSGIDFDAIIFGDHFNDLGESEADVKSAMLSTVQAVIEQFPKARKFMLGGWLVDEQLTEKQINLDDYTRELCDTYNMKPLMYSNPYNTWDSTSDWSAGVNYVRGNVVRYKGVVWECVEDHTSSGSTINTAGFNPSLIITSSNASVTMLGDLIHPTESTCNAFGAAFSKVVVSG